MSTALSQRTNVSLIERVDIHKSCKALETIVNVFNDYCQAAESLGLVQKRLAKALKEAVGLKATNELASNALTAVASLLEALSEVDVKFVKIADKESEEASNDLKKWFKKLAKEEKNHDERIASANAKIKQAGQTYEKRAKKKDLSAAEEHARYVNLLGVIGPEMSQEKYNHALLVTQKHTTTLYNVTASISRTADAEWVRACECVRRFAPIIGRIGECRAYLEGGWTGPAQGYVIQDAPALRSGDDADGEKGSTSGGKVDENTNGDVHAPTAATLSTSESESTAPRTPAPAYTPAASAGASTTPSSASSSQLAVSTPSTSTPLAVRPPPSSFPVPTDRQNTDSVRSIESLSSFPTPPSHFPIPSLAPTTSSPLAQMSSVSRVPDRERKSSYFSEDPQMESNPWTSSTSNLRPGTSSEPSLGLAPVMESPKSLEAPLHSATPALTEDRGRSPMSNQGEPSTPRDRLLVSYEAGQALSSGPARQEIMDVRKTNLYEQSRQGGSMGSPLSEDSRGAAEGTEPHARTNSIVASIRDKWGSGNVPSSPLPERREMPRLPGKVADLAIRYSPMNDKPPSPVSARAAGQGSPIPDRRSSPIRERKPSGTFGLTAATYSSSADVPAHSSPVASPTARERSQALDAGPSADEIAARRRQIEELEELEMREQALAVRSRERQIEMRSIELEREREQFRMLGVSARVKNTSTASSNGAVRPHSQYSYSTTNLVPPIRAGGPSVADAPARPVSQYGDSLHISYSQTSASVSSVSIPKPPADHAAFCGCYACSAAQYAVPSQPTPDVKPDKPKGWMRRLSMPVVGNAFSSDTKKNGGSPTAANSMGAMGNRGTGQAVGYVTEDGRLQMPKTFEQDATGGISNVTRSRKLSFGRR